MNKELDRAIDHCIGVRGNRAFDGSYAAPREAFRKILCETLAADREAIRKEVEGLTRGLEHNHSSTECEGCAQQHMAGKVLSLLTPKNN